MHAIFKQRSLKRLSFALILTLFLMVLAACGTPSNANQGNQGNNTPQVTPTPTPSPTPTPDPATLKACQFMSATELAAIVPGSYVPADKEQEVTDLKIKQKICTYAGSPITVVVGIYTGNDAVMMFSGMKEQPGAIELPNLGEGAVQTKLAEVDYVFVKKGQLLFQVGLLDTRGSGNSAQNIESTKKIADLLAKKA